MGKLAVLLKNNDIVFAIGLVVIVLMMVIPMPSQLLDLLLTINISLSVLILLVCLYTKEPLDYSSFPTILLVATLFRLGLNVTSTRLILLEANAGSVIESFGQFVIGGNYVVGFVIFVILVIINFMVITGGAGRVAEVSARFTLDSMPGKQLSIDADLNSGLIDEKEAKLRRKKLEREADFYGTMDGASKFVKGDATAGIIITVVNIVGGLVIGILQLKMDPATALSTYTILTVGDGLVSQIPALIISTATGLIISRASGSDRSLSEDIGLADPRALEVAVAAYQACHLIGMPECSVHLTEAAVYMSLAPKSNALYVAYESAKKDALTMLAEPVPLVIRNAPTKLMKELEYGKGYQYAHDTKDKLTDMQCLPDSLLGKEYYRPTEEGLEARFGARLREIKEWKKEYKK